MESDGPFYDVVILNEHRIVTSVVASKTHLNEGYFSAKRWKNTWLPRVVEPNRVAIVKHSCGLGEEISFSEEIPW